MQHQSNKQQAEAREEVEVRKGISEETKTVKCDRCSGPMFRMRAVYWCTNCGYKTDCCGH